MYTEELHIVNNYLKICMRDILRKYKSQSNKLFLVNILRIAIIGKQIGIVDLCSSSRQTDLKKKIFVRTWELFGIRTECRNITDHSAMEPLDITISYIIEVNP